MIWRLDAATQNFMGLPSNTKSLMTAGHTSPIPVYAPITVLPTIPGFPLSFMNMAKIKDDTRLVRVRKMYPCFGMFISSTLNPNFSEYHIIQNAMPAIAANMTLG